MHWCTAQHFLKNCTDVSNHIFWEEVLGGIPPDMFREEFHLFYASYHVLFEKSCTHASDQIRFEKSYEFCGTKKRSKINWWRVPDAWRCWWRRLYDDIYDDIISPELNYVLKYLSFILGKITSSEPHVEFYNHYNQFIENITITP